MIASAYVERKNNMSFLDEFFGAPSHQQDTAGPPYMAPILRRDYAAAAPLLKKAMQNNDARAMGLMAVFMAPPLL